MDDVTIYTNKDGRTRVYLKDKKKVISYPRFIMEKELGRSLQDKEEIHHIDGNPLNNEISNLEIRVHGEHQREHSTKYFDKNITCPNCGKEFVWTALQQRYYYSNLSRKNRIRKSNSGPFCSRKCSGLYHYMIQNK